MNTIRNVNYLEKTIKRPSAIKITNNLKELGDTNIKKEIFDGLLSHPKYISSKFFYDSYGSKLFEEITKLDEYYPTRTEKSILNSFITNLNLDFKNLNIIELGSGDHSKISLLLKQIPDNLLSTITYYPVDISRSAVEESSINLLKEFSDLNINGIITDFMHNLILPKSDERRLVCFLGSTIGNLSPDEVNNFMKKIGNDLNVGDVFLLGIDMVKDKNILHCAYNDTRKITAEFNKNILNVINEIMQSNFDNSNFEHLAFYNEQKQRIEMYLVANCDMTISLGSNYDNIQIEKGEKIRTEYSHKFSTENIEQFGSLSGLEIENIFTDKKKWYSLVQFVKKT